MRLYLTSQFYYVAGSIGPKIARSHKSHTVFIDTALKYKSFTDAELAWHYHDIEALKREDFVFDYYDITAKTPGDLERDLAQYQTIYVQGGNTFYLLQEAQKSGFDTYITRRVREGMIYIGTSAGSVIAGIDTAANARPGKSYTDYELSGTAGFGLVNFAIIPHWGAESKKGDHLTYKIPQAYHEDYPYILLNNDQYIEVEDDWFNIVGTSK